MSLILIIILAPILNRWRGGGWPFLPGEIHGGPNDKKRTQVRRIPFVAAFGLITYSVLGNVGHDFTLPFVGWEVFLPTWLLVSLSVYASLLTGWGFPLSAAVKANTRKWQEEWWPLDIVTLGLVGHQDSHRYGVVWLTLHGALFGSLVGLALQSPIPAVLWAFMGLSYSYAQDWERGEIVDGLIKGLAIALTLVFTN